ncbi:type II toxin-antitoxin system HicB family antitoxin [Piscirickettsia litoralis]|uniref:HicB-like antitoxin of toxin-antitoxin system domain-containing protein n=1 Tax=Piscirickettsia litoralis TaxID=1891921 RepID=A0ABX2ZWG0_9GAMM|nr:type II toxin-antitoxin system HicB family antitoxin [Piscirickettsia litoralis]ODN40947.1 hypothetical protein BGC07_18975 [Piscirickettsia litoralis]
MIYPVVVMKDKTSDYTVAVPDLPGIITAGDSYEDAIEMAKDAIDGHVECLSEAGEDIPRGSDLQDHVANPDFTGGVWFLVEVDIALRHP